MKLEHWGEVGAGYEDSGSHSPGELFELGEWIRSLRDKV